MKWSVVAPLCLVAGCTYAHDLGRSEPQRLSAAGQDPPASAVIAADSGAASAARNFVMWTEGEEGAAGKLVVYDLDAHAEEVAATWAAGEMPPEVCYLPNPTSPQSPYTGRDPAETPRWQPAGGGYLYIDRATGRVVRPWPALRLSDDPSYLIDIIGERALVIYLDATFAGPLATGELVLFRGGERESLGKVWLITFMDAIGGRYFALSPDRNHIIWTGPNGTHVADLRSAKVIERPGRYRWRGRTSGLPGFEAGERVVDWLPDGSGVIEYWHDGDEAWHWEIFEPLGDTPIARGNGRIAGFSPDCTHMLIHNEEARKYAAGFWNPDVPPYTLRPAPVRVAPGPRHDPHWQKGAGHWAVHADGVSYFAGGRVSDTEKVIYRITPAGFHTFTVDVPDPMYVTVLSADDGGRLGGGVHLEYQAATPEAERRYETIIYDFDGNEKMRLDGYPTAADPDTGVCTLIERDGKHNRVKLVNALTGEARLVPGCEAPTVRVSLQGSHFVAHAYAEPNGERDLDLYVGRAGDAEWTLVARGVHSPRTAPMTPGHSRPR